MAVQNRERTKVFISYGRADAKWLERLRVHLRPLERDNNVDIWDDTRIKPGSRWREEIKEAIASAKVAVLLISADFLASDFIATDELPPLLTAAEEDGAVILPLIISPSRFLSTPALSGFQCVNPPSNPLINMTKGEQEEVLVRLTDNIEASLQYSGHTPAPASVPTATAKSVEAQPPRTSNKAPTADRYDIIHTIYQGHYSRVIKCRIRNTGEICIVKETESDRVCVKALEILRDRNFCNIAAPRLIWEENGKIYEEIPYVGGVRLSKAIARGVGGLTGSVLESFHEQLMNTLGQLHKADIIHRDIHPDNIYMVIKRGDPDFTQRPNSALGTWRYDSFGYGDEQFFIAWVLVDCTFATLSSESPKSRYRHGTYTPEEQEVGGAIAASDMYAFGATLYYGITGHEIPSFQARRAGEEPKDFPSGGHSSRLFSHHLRNLLSLDPTERLTDPNLLQMDSVSEGYTGTLKISNTVLLVANHFATATQMLAGKEALHFYQNLLASYNYKKRADAEYWINYLKGVGVGNNP
ncbi:MAG: TIR domain-containing protein [Acidobacteriota bacterium]|nr:TIR domain-containing protein [Acidobacteriota bacterium]